MGSSSGSAVAVTANMAMSALQSPPHSPGTGSPATALEPTRPRVATAAAGSDGRRLCNRCAIGEETGTSIRGPACYSSCVGIAATQELVSRDGMIDSGANTRCGPICRTVTDAARVLSVISGYDPRDEATAASVGRASAVPYESYCTPQNLTRPLAGLRLGVLRECALGFRGRLGNNLEFTAG